MRNGTDGNPALNPLPYLPPDRAADAALLEKKRLGVAAAKCSKISRLVSSELEISVTGAHSAPGTVQTLTESAEDACRCGEIVLKPFLPRNGAAIGVETVRHGRFRVLARDPGGTPVLTEFVSTAVREGKKYLRRELHELTDGACVVTNTVTSEDLTTGRIERAALTDVREWAEISPRAVLRNVTAPLFSVFRANPEGEPLFRRGAKLIGEIEKQFDRLIWEYEGGELAIDASVDAFRIGRDGRPELRDASYIRGLNRLLMHYEDAVGIARGTFSDPDAVARSAGCATRSTSSRLCISAADRGTSGSRRNSATA